MPGRDRTGPQGRGPLTGRGAGPCNPNFDDAEFAGYGFGRGWQGGRGGGRGGRGRGWGGGRGRGRGWGWGRDDMDMGARERPMAVRSSEELEQLRRRARQVQQALTELEARIRELEAQEPGSP